MKLEACSSERFVKTFYWMNEELTLQLEIFVYVVFWVCIGFVFYVYSGCLFSRLNLPVYPADVMQWSIHIQKSTEEWLISGIELRQHFP